MPFELMCVVDSDPVVANGLAPLYERGEISLRLTSERGGYWKALKLGCQETKSEMIATLANDLLPGVDWLKRAFTAHREMFKDDGLVGFQDGIHYGEHAAHFLVSRSMLKRWYGEDYFPLCYDHAQGDTEISLRAQQEGKFAVATFSILYHNHYFVGAAYDSVYELGSQKIDKDRETMLRRFNNGWKD